MDSSQRRRELTQLVENRLNGKGKFITMGETESKVISKDVIASAEVRIKDATYVVYIRYKETRRASEFFTYTLPESSLQKSPVLREPDLEEEKTFLRRRGMTIKNPTPREITEAWVKWFGRRD